MRTKIRLFVYWRLFDLYLYLSEFGERIEDHYRVYDHLGLIDTLGHNSAETKFTKYYSDELTCWFIIKLPFGYKLILDDGYNNDKHIYLTKK